jgi:hypothetical protein
MNEDNNKEHNEEEEQFSDDPEEQLRIENELLRLKLQAETGAELQQLNNIPPDVENAFLNNILAFERQLDSIEETKIFDLIGQPADFKNESELNNEEIETELERLSELLESHQIEVDYGTDYPSRLKYKFITEELFEHSTQKFDIPDMVHHFIYEEFHPNHTLSIEGIAEDFLEMWFSRNMEKDSYIFSDEMVSKDGESVTKEQFLLRVQHVFDAYIDFENAKYEIQDVSFHLTHEGQDPTATGYADGILEYDAVLENKEIQKIKSPFKLYMQQHCGYWELFKINMQGLEL